MQKICPVCSTSFKTKDSRQRSCGKECADALRREWRPAPPTPSSEASTKPLVDISKLPPVENLPAAYVKRCYDLWCALVGDGDMTTRIA